MCNQFINPKGLVRERPSSQGLEPKQDSRAEWKSLKAGGGQGEDSQGDSLSVGVLKDKKQLEK